MKLKEVNIVGGTVYVNIVTAEETTTETLAADKAVSKYGELEVIEHTPYQPAGEPAGSDGGETAAREQGGKKGKKKALKPGTDVVILQG